MTEPPSPLVSHTPAALAALARSTVSHYQAHAVDFREGTKGHDVSQNVDALLRALPGPASVKPLLTLPNPSEGQLFQMGELLKAVRDQNPQRYFQIHDGLEEGLQKEPHFVVLHYQYCRMLRDPGIRLAHALACICGPTGEILVPEWKPPAMSNAVRTALADAGASMQ